MQAKVSVTTTSAAAAGSVLFVDGEAVLSTVPLDATGAASYTTTGLQLGLRVHPEVLTVMQEVGIDLSEAKPQKLTQELANDAALLITMGCGDKCPYVPGLRRDDWPLKDPKGLPLEEVRLMRDEVKSRVQELVGASILA